MVAGVLEPATVSSSCSREHNHKMKTYKGSLVQLFLSSSPPVRCTSEEEAAEGKRGSVLEGKRGSVLEGNQAMLRYLAPPTSL